MNKSYKHLVYKSFRVNLVSSQQKKRLIQLLTILLVIPSIAIAKMPRADRDIELVKKLMQCIYLINADILINVNILFMGNSCRAPLEYFAGLLEYYLLLINIIWKIISFYFEKGFCFIYKMYNH